MLLARYTKWNRTCVAFWLRFGLHTFLNTGDFFDGTYQDYILGTRTPQNYRNPFLARAMVNIKMIDTQGLGVHNLYLGQKNRFLPLPDYDLRDPGKTSLRITGTVIDRDYIVFRVFHLFHSPCGTEQDFMRMLLVQELFDLHPVEERFGAEGFDFVDGWIDGSAKFYGPKVNGRVEMLDLVDAFFEQD